MLKRHGGQVRIEGDGVVDDTSDRFRVIEGNWRGDLQLLVPFPILD